MSNASQQCGNLGMCCFMTNVRSIVNKLTDFSLFINDFNPDSVALPETWLHTDLFVPTDDYSVFRKDRPGRRVGVRILIKRCLNLTVTETMLPTEYLNLEIVAADICDKMSTTMRIECAYRPPDYNAADHNLFSVALKHISDNCARICLMGDFNLPDFNWMHFIHPDNMLYKDAPNLIFSQGLSKIVTQPTRGDNIWDLVLVSDPICGDNNLYLALLLIVITV